jgi:hypothetical protein
MQCDLIYVRLHRRVRLAGLNYFNIFLSVSWMSTVWLSVIWTLTNVQSLVRDAYYMHLCLVNENCGGSLPFRPILDTIKYFLSQSDHRKTSVPLKYTLYRILNVQGT